MVFKDRSLMRSPDKDTYIAEEVFVVLHSGEIPEVTLHESLYHLTEDPDGPCLKLHNKDVLPLKRAVIKRYRAIILRDLDPENRDKRIYRGLARCAANWQRLLNFCTRENMDFQEIRIEAAQALKEFLAVEVADVQRGRRCSCINCTYKDIETLVNSLGLSVDDLPAGLQDLCL